VTTAPCDYCAYCAELEAAQAKPVVATPGILAEITTVAFKANCGHCWAAPGDPCDAPGGGTHLARYARARRRGILSGPDMCVVLDAAGDVFEPATVIRLEAVPA